MIFFGVQMAKYRLYILAVATLCAVGFANSSKCDRTPVASSASKSPPDGRFRLHIKSDPIRYVPYEAYEISLEAVQRQTSHQPNTFMGFYLTVEKDFTESNLNPLRPVDIRNGNGETSVGRFEIISHESAKFSEKCNNLVTHTTTVAVQSVQVRWIAPGNGSGCVAFKSTIIERRDVWFSDDGPLSIKLCEDAADSGDVQPLVLDECSACHEAKYELTIERLWSKHTHPKDFPIGWDTKFGDVIGASHINDFRVWSYGEHASEGMGNLAKHGTTEDLESELKGKVGDVRTIIKARGIAHPDIYGKTYAVFRVDPTHHLISLASMIYPSPDWFIGVSGLELCLSNGSWVEQKELNLYPYDAGVDNGPSYTSPDQPTKPQEAIRRLKPNQPNDIRSPFHDTESKSMKPMAKLIITLQRLYENNCNENEDGSVKEEEANESENDDEDNGRSGGGGRERGRQRDRDRDDDTTNNQLNDDESNCETTEWSEWSPCDMSCGGKRKKERRYKNTGKSTAKWRSENCKKALVEVEDCQDTGDDCNKQDDTIDIENNASQLTRSDCRLTDWSEFSECLKTCGKGEVTRTRDYINKKNRKDCEKAFPSDNLAETRECEGQDCSGDIGDETRPPARKAKCPAPANFGKWSKCSEKKCGEMVRVKDISGVSKILMKDENMKKLLSLHNKIVKSKNRKLDKDDYQMIELEDDNHPCHGVELMQLEACDKDDPDCNTICNAEPPTGNCDGEAENRWYFIKEKGECGIFTYRGCNGTNNSFYKEEECMQACENQPTSDRWQSWSLVKHHNNEVNNRIDCTVSQWKQQRCNATCSEDGIKWRYRTIIQHSRNGGLPCPRTIAQVERCWKNCDDDSEEMFIKQSSSNGKAISTNKRKQQQSSAQKPINSQLNQQQQHCRYSDWSAWSPCSKTCGDFAVQIRTRAVLSRLNGHLCTERMEERSCDVMPCIINRYNYRVSRA